MTSRIGLVQTNTRDNFKENLVFAFEQIAEAGRQGLALVAFPETFLYVGRNHDEKFRSAMTIEGEIVQQFQEAARVNNVSVLMGSHYERIPGEPERLYNTSILLSRSGEILGVYRKIHMCDAPSLGHRESKGIRPGDKTVVVDHEIGKIGLTICYDLRFPALFQHLTAKGAEIIFTPAAFFVKTGNHHWFPLLQTRAIENQIFIAAPAQFGWHYEDRFSYGKSLLIDPWGTATVCAPEKIGLISGSVDLEYLRDMRRNMPSMEHRRPEVYPDR